MQGTRVIDDGRDPYLQLKGKGPGAYVGPIVRYTANKPAVFFLLPIEGEPVFAHVCMPPHQFFENADGTLTIEASILTRNDKKELYHGYLRNGEWISC